MTLRHSIAAVRDDFLTAVQFLTRVPVHGIPFTADSLPRAVKFFPVVGLLLGILAGLLQRAVAAHLPRLVAAVLVIAFLVVATGALHEDAIGDAADGFGCGGGRERILALFKDSRIGSYGATALLLALTARIMLVATLPMANLFSFLVAAVVISRWSILPLGYWLPAARMTREADAAVDVGQGSKIANSISRGTLSYGTLFTLAAVGVALRKQAFAALIAAALVTILTGIYYRRRIGGVTGDCFGTTVQLVEIAVLLTGVWTA